MQLTNFLPTLALLLPQVVVVFASGPGFRLKREESTTDPSSWIAEKPELVGRQLLDRRATGTCSPGYYMCDPSIGEGCCKTGYTCGDYNGVLGCCPNGKSCSGVGSCLPDEVDCGTYCCAAGNTCTTDALGKPACGTGGGGSFSTVTTDLFTFNTPTVTTRTIPGNTSTDIPTLIWTYSTTSTTTTTSSTRTTSTTTRKTMTSTSTVSTAGAAAMATAGAMGLMAGVVGGLLVL